MLRYGLILQCHKMKFRQPLQRAMIAIVSSVVSQANPYSLQLCHPVSYKTRSNNQIYERVESTTAFCAAWEKEVTHPITTALGSQRQDLAHTPEEGRRRGHWRDWTCWGWSGWCSGSYHCMALCAVHAQFLLKRHLAVIGDVTRTSPFKNIERVLIPDWWVTFPSSSFPGSPACLLWVLQHAVSLSKGLH